MYWGGFLWPCMEGERNGEDTFNSHISALSGTYDNEERTTSLQRTNCLPPAYILFLHFYIPQKKGQPLNNGQNIRPQCVHYS